MSIIFSPPPSHALTGVRPAYVPRVLAGDQERDSALVARVELLFGISRLFLTVTAVEDPSCIGQRAGEPP